jgi:hypothetical protein
MVLLEHCALASRKHLESAILIVLRERLAEVRSLRLIQ